MWQLFDPERHWRETLKLQKQENKFVKEGFQQQLHLQLLTNIFASSFLDESLILHRKMGPQVIVFSPFFFLFCFPKKCDNSKHTNLIFFFHCERQRTHLLKATLFSLSLLFLAHVGSSLLPSLLANEIREGQDVHYDTIEGKRDDISFKLTVLDMTRRSTGRVKGSKVTVFNSKGFHATVARTTSTTAGRSSSCRSSPYCFRRFHLFFSQVESGFGGRGWVLHSLDRLKEELWTCRWKITKKAIHGRSAIQARLLFSCSDMNNSGKIQPLIFCHKSVFGEPTFPSSVFFLHFPEGHAQTSPEQQRWHTDYWPQPGRTVQVLDFSTCWGG